MGEDVDLKDVSGVTVSPAVLYDDDGKALPADQQPSFKFENGVLEWYTGAYLKKGEEYTLTYRVKLNNIESPGQYVPLNGATSLTYEDKDGKSHDVGFNVPQVAYATGTLLVTASGLPKDAALHLSLIHI